MIRRVSANSNFLWGWGGGWWCVISGFPRNINEIFLFWDILNFPLFFLHCLNLEGETDSLSKKPVTNYQSTPRTFQGRKYHSNTVGRLQGKGKVIQLQALDRP
jgi:hypothetical protein